MKGRQSNDKKGGGLLRWVPVRVNGCSSVQVEVVGIALMVKLSLEPTSVAPPPFFVIALFPLHHFFIQIVYHHLFILLL